MSLPRLSSFALVAVLAGLLVSCQKSEEHPPFVEGCQKNCAQLPGIGLPGQGGAPPVDPDQDAGTGTLQGKVMLLSDPSFVKTTVYANGATVTADGASGSPVTADWVGGDGSTPYVLEGVSRVGINWISVKPDVVEDPLLTYHAVQAGKVSSDVNLGLVPAATLDIIFNAVSTLRSPDSGQVILFFRSAGTGVPLAGLRVTMAKAQAGIFAAANGWVLDDGTAETDKSGLVVFGNVEPANSNGTQTVVVTRAATSTLPAAAAGQFAVKVVQAAVSIATIDVQL